MFDWPSFRAQWLPGDWLGDEPEADLRRCYTVKYELAKRFRPKTIGEIGVRAGYAALAFLLACPDAQYIGYDAENGMHGGEPGAVDWAKRILAPYNATVRELNTQKIAALPDAAFDMLHVDGDHSVEGAYHDITLGMAVSRVVVVDDVDFIPEVREAVTKYLEAHPTVRIELVGDGGYRGNAVLRSERSPFE